MAAKTLTSASESDLARGSGAGDPGPASPLYHKRKPICLRDWVLVWYGWREVRAQGVRYVDPADRARVDDGAVVAGGL